MHAGRPCTAWRLVGLTVFIAAQDLRRVWIYLQLVLHVDSRINGESRRGWSNTKPCSSFKSSLTVDQGTIHASSRLDFGNTDTSKYHACDKVR